MSTTIPIYYAEMGVDHGHAFGCDDKGLWETKPYLVNWYDRWTFIQAMRGTSQVIGGSGLGGGAGVWYRANIPYQHPEIPSLYAQDVSAKGVSLQKTPNGITGHKAAIISVTFRTPVVNYQMSDQQPGVWTNDAEKQAMLWCRQELDFGSEGHSIPKSTLKFMSDNLVIKDSGSVRVSTVGITLTWEQYPLFPFNRMQAFVDCVNDATLFGCLRGSLFFKGPKIVSEASTDGSLTQKVQMQIDWRSVDWNKKLRPDSYAWDTVGAVSGGASLYAYKNFLGLFL